MYSYSFKVDLYRFLFEEDDGPDNSILVSIERIDKPTFLYFYGRINIFIEEEDEFNLLCERFQRLLGIISKNRYIVVLAFWDNFHVPGTLLAEWLDSNEFVSTIYMNLPKNQSDIELLCDALKRNTTIKTVILTSIKLQGKNLQLFSKALGGNTGIENIKFCRCCSATATMIIMRETLGENSTIKSLTFSKFNRMSIDFVNEIKEILSENTSLTKFHMVDADPLGGPRNGGNNMAPILHGIINSGITDFHFTTVDLYDKDDIKHELFQMIGEMKNLKSFTFRLKDFEELSVETIFTALKGIKSLALLKINQSGSYPTHHLEMNRLKGIIQHMVTKEWYCKLHLKCVEPHLDLIDLLSYVQLERFECHNIERCTFDKIMEGIPTWNFLHDVKFYISSGFLNTKADNRFTMYETKFISAICKNSSLKSIAAKLCGKRKHDFLSVGAQEKVNKVLERNEYLAECMYNPERVPITKWLELLVMADPTGINFSYECIRKIPSVFISLLRNADINQDNNA